MRLILASSSKARATILRRGGFDFEICPSHIDETPYPNETARELVIRLAIAKAQAVSHLFPNALIIGSDQVAEYQKKIIGKPSGYEQGLEFLMSFRNQTVEFINGLCLLNTKNNTYETRLNIIQTIFRNYDQKTAENYLKIHQPYECAGSLKVEGPGIRLLSSIQNQDPNALEGLCIIDLITLLEHQGFELSNF